MIKKITASATIIVLIIVIAAVVVGAGLFLFPYPPNEPPIANETLSTEQGVETVVNANNQFAFELYSRLNKDKDKNIFYSPYSISAALAMTYEGAKGKTADEMQSVFHFPESDVLRSNFAKIYNDINKVDKKYQLRTGNALWAENDFRFLEDYFTRVEKYYGGKATNLDFINEPEKSRLTINNFISEQTNNKIKDLLPENSINPATRLILTNAIYFKGTWQWQFDKSKTSEQDFKITEDNIKKVPMMHMDNEKTSFNYTETIDLQILELPYKGDDISMLIILPKKDLESIEPSLSVDNIDKWKSQMREVELNDIYLPKFEFDTKYSMKEALSELGMPTAFDPISADFSGMTGKNDLYIEFVIHQAYVKVDEEGTEAAAATAVGMTLTAMPEQNIFRADHPFIFIIQDKNTGNILFLGKVVDPTK